ncbi:PREDICTED: uncharacterized protein C5E4.10c [Nicotiana attenuata]|uniref:uncharacterized protein C5E4.10c n=1 Tax=Nicotiana attenuata TaxID=49451 RepID=UPI000905464B|nr:PREDICTED: uncharacterized protein C5E4.10c [Nicotiana attenuata]
MGGHGGLNILPQKRWNVYNYENREKVKRDEEAAAKEEQLKQEQSRKRDSEYRLEQLRQARGLSSSSSNHVTKSSSEQKSPEKKPEKSKLAEEKPGKSDSKHINLFEGIRIFGPVKKVEEDEEKNGRNNNKRIKKEQAPRVITAEDEKYRLGYGIVGKGTKLPWYMENKKRDEDEKSDEDNDNDYYKYSRPVKKSSNGGKKTVEELRQERFREGRGRRRKRKLC